METEFRLLAGFIIAIVSMPFFFLNNTLITIVALGVLAVGAAIFFKALGELYLSRGQAMKEKENK